MTDQCKSCGGFCGKTCQRENVLTKVDGALINEGTRIEPVAWMAKKEGYTTTFTQWEPEADRLVNVELVPLVPASALAAEQAKVRELVEVLRKTLVSMEATVSWQETRIGRPPNQTCLFEIEEASAAIAKYGDVK